jgi:hypothetical protein
MKNDHPMYIYIILTTRDSYNYHNSSYNKNNNNTVILTTRCNTLVVI